MDERYNWNNAHQKKISNLIYEYVINALEDSLEVVCFISLNGREDENFQAIRRVHISDIQSYGDLHIGDRECLRIYPEDSMLALLDDETG